jgi:hypothetical protein
MGDDGTLFQRDIQVNRNNADIVFASANPPRRTKIYLTQIIYNMTHRQDTVSSLILVPIKSGL